MTRIPAPTPELADVVRRFSPLMPELPGEQRRVLSDIAVCRTAALGGHMETCDQCGHQRPAYNSCRNRHCPKCQASACATWLDEQAADLLPVPYFHVVFTLPNAFNSLALGNKRVVYGLLFQAVSRTLLQVAADPKRLGAQIGFLAVLHTWGQNLYLHPHLHCVVPGGGLSPDGAWKACLPGFFLPVRVLSRLFRRLFLDALEKAYADGELRFFAELEPLREASAFTQYLAPVRQTEWVVYAKPPFGGPPQVIEYLGRYTHRVAISNQRLVALEDGQVSFRWKDYRHADKQQVTTVSAEEFIRRFLLHALPPGFQRIRYFGLLANCHRAGKLRLCRQELAAPTAGLLPVPQDYRDFYAALTGKNLRICPECGIGTMVRIELLPPCHSAAGVRMDSS